MALCGMTTIYANSSPIVLARILNSSGGYLKQNDVSSIKLNIIQIRERDRIPVPNWENVSIPKANVIFDELQLDSLWTDDNFGYNFKYIFEYGSNFPFSESDRLYLATFQIVLTNNASIVLGRRIRTI